ncbi:MAG: hypothetical protein ACREUU_21155, partial [Gammaproteobacteria bacterium]
MDHFRNFPTHRPARSLIAPGNRAPILEESPPAVNRRPARSPCYTHERSEKMKPSVILVIFLALVPA